ncbi:dihydroorotate dehydrogenase B (NAD(+)), catalytic subunit [Clostridia bacterium]|nr:dihydroorotate dehydrogenase B (NAD(+)), catalytic subunit [Clostridia bacterium]
MLETKICGINFKNPIIAASGTFGYGREYAEMYDLSILGGISTKGTTLLPREGNLPPRIAETPNGMLNSVGLQNGGVDKLIETELPFLKHFDTVIIANIAGSTIDEYAEIAEKLDATNVDMLEVNISCPNVKEGGVAFGTNAKIAADVTKAVRLKTTKPVIMKLSPNVTDITEIARACEAAGADCISLINTLLGMRINIATKRPILHNNVGGFSGEAIFPVALRMVFQVANAVKLPIIGMGGVVNGKEAIEMLIAGACAVQIGTAIITDPFAPQRIIKEISDYLTENNLTLKEIIGSVVPN